MTVEQLIAENERRNAVRDEPYNPLTGQGAILERRLLQLSDYVLPEQWVPLSMFDNQFVRRLAECGSIAAFVEKYLEIICTPDVKEKVVRQLIRVRNKHDFCFWAYSFAVIKPKKGGDDIPFRLNRPQRRLVEKLERQRLAGKPIRLILLKARQWGGSTAIQMYMAWIQLNHQKGWNSIIVGHVNAASLEVKGMFTKLMDNYPLWLLHDEFDVYELNEKKIRPFEGSQTIDIIPQRNCKIKVGTAESPENARGGDSAMAHCTEVAFWKKTDNKTPEQIVKSVCSGVIYTPLTLEIFESTANGTGNYFHQEWERARRGESDKDHLFIPWFEIESYALPVDDAVAFARELYLNRNNEQNNGNYNWQLWQWGATFEAIEWYMVNRKRYKDHADMASEFPSDDIEAFKHSGHKVFDQYKCESLRATCKAPRWVGDVYGDATEGKAALRNLRFAADRQGVLKVWGLPETDIEIKNRYLTVVDVGGRSSGSDPSDILVIDRYWMMDGDRPEVVAEWHGHIDHDLLAWKAAQIAAFYNNSLLVIESNTLETRDPERDTDGNHTHYILNQIGDVYPNLYAREQSDEDISAGAPRKWGFHTNTSTKPMIIDHQVRMVRECAYIERETEAVDEHLCYEKRQNGSFGAIAGRHDDRLMTRAIGLFICYNSMPPPKIVERKAPVMGRRAISAATI
jgi:hypothetical protein